MANYKITTLNSVNLTDNKYIYKDIALDFKMGYSNNGQFYKNKEVKDLVADVDYKAVKNSIFNLFNTNLGERILNPSFGLNLKSYLFEGVTRETGYVIGDVIKAGISRFEPRVTIQRITIIANEDQNTYEVTLIVSIKALQNATLTLPGIVSNSGFQYIS